MSKFEDILKSIESGKEYGASIVHALRDAVNRLEALEKKVEDAFKSKPVPTTEVHRTAFPGRVLTDSKNDSKSPEPVKPSAGTK